MVNAKTETRLYEQVWFKILCEWIHTDNLNVIHYSIGRT